MSLFPITKVPLTVSGIITWLDAADINNGAPQPANSTAIPTWYNKADSRFNVTQGTGAFQPIYTQNAINGKDGLAWNGVNTAMFNSSYVDFNTCTVFAVTSQASDPTQCTLEVSDGSILTGFLIFYQVATTFRSVNSSNLYDASFTESLPFTQITTGVVDGTNTLIYVNNDLKQTTPSGPINATTNTVYIGQLTGVTDYTLAGYIGEILIYNRALSGDEITLINQYLANKWGIPL